MGLYDVSTNEKKTNPELVAGGTLYADSPIGTIIPYGGASAPSGWFLCQGQALSRTTYSELFAVIGTSFGVGDGSTTFNLPDMRESVPKGAGLTGKTVGAHLDADGLAVGEFLDDRVQSHDHGINITSANSGNKRAVNWDDSKSPNNDYTMITTNRGRYGDTTEVKSVGVNYIIKAKMVAVPADFMSKVDEAVEDVYGDIIPSDASSRNKLLTQKYVVGEIFPPNTTKVIHTTSNNVIEILGMPNNNTDLLDTVITVGYSGQTRYFDKGNINPTITSVYDSTSNTYDISITTADTFIVSITSCRGVTIS